jgi:hypothetical protein
MKELDNSQMFLINLQPLRPDTKGQSLFCISSKTGNGSDIQETFDQIITKVKMQMPVPVLSFGGDLSYNFLHDDFHLVGRYLSQRWLKSRQVTEHNAGYPCDGSDN